MKRIAAFLIVATAGLAACESSEDRARKADEARQEADRKADQIARDTDKKLEDSKRKAEEEQDKIRREGQEKTDEVRQASEKTTRDDADATVKARADLRDSSNKKLDDIDKDVVDLDKKLHEKLSRGDYDNVMQNVKAKGDAARQSVNNVDRTTDFDTAKKTINDRIDDYKNAVSDAKKRL